MVADVDQPFRARQPAVGAVGAVYREPYPSRAEKTATRIIPIKQEGIAARKTNVAIRLASDLPPRFQAATAPTKSLMIVLSTRFAPASSSVHGRRSPLMSRWVGAVGRSTRSPPARGTRRSGRTVAARTGRSVLLHDGLALRRGHQPHVLAGEEGQGVSGVMRGSNKFRTSSPRSTADPATSGRSADVRASAHPASPADRSTHASHHAAVSPTSSNPRDRRMEADRRSEVNRDFRISVVQNRFIHIASLRELRGWITASGRPTGSRVDGWIDGSDEREGGGGRAVSKRQPPR